MISEGKRIKARGVIAALGKTSGGSPQVAVELEILSGPDAGHSITWFGYFTEKTQQRTIESLRHLGWKGDDLSALDGIDANEVSIEIHHEEYNGEQQAKVKWINASGGLAMRDAMGAADAKAFAQSMRGAVIQANAAAKQRGGSAPAPRNGAPARAPSTGGDAPPHTDDDIPF